MPIIFRNEEFEFGASMVTKNGDWGLDICIKKTADIIDFGCSYSTYNGTICFYLPLLIVSIGTPFYQKGDN